MPKEISPRIVTLEVARLLRNERVRQGISIRRVALMAGLSQPMVGYVERGMRNPTLDTALRIANALNVDFSRLIKQASRPRRRTKVS